MDIFSSIWINSVSGPTGFNKYFKKSKYLRLLFL